MMRSATLYGIGVGPGDADLMTMKAHNILRRVPVVAYPTPEDAKASTTRKDKETGSMVRAIAAPHITHTCTELPLLIPMVRDQARLRVAYDDAATAIESHLHTGRDVAVLCEGDPFLYGSFMYLYKRLVPDWSVEVVPGVSSVTACAAAAGLPLVAHDDCLSIIPATGSMEVLRTRLLSGEAVAIMKLSRHGAAVCAVLAETGRATHAVYIERVGHGNERVLPLAAADPHTMPYFSMILVPAINGD